MEGTSDSSYIEEILEWRINNGEENGENTKNVIRAQIYLTKIGFNLGNYGKYNDGVDGGLGKLTKQSVKTLQDILGFSPTGEINEETLKQLEMVYNKGWTIYDNVLELNPENIQEENSGYIKPVYGGSFSSPFGMRDHPVDDEWTMHNGVDIGGYTSGALENSPLYAADDGYITYIRRNGGDAGNYIILQGDKGMSFRYLHMNAFNEELENEAKNTYNEVRVSVKKGDFIGYVGNTGVGTGPHLHFEIFNNKYGTDYDAYKENRENPENYLDIR